MLNPGQVDAIQASGRHEIGIHGWIHERLPLLKNIIMQQASGLAGDLPLLARRSTQPAIATK